MSEEKRINKISNQYGAEQIQVLEGLEPVRKRPGMYIGKLGDGSSNDDGIYILLKEVVDNGIDEFIKATNNIFTAFSQISIKILHIHQTEHVLIFELKIILDNTITLLVVDILEFTKDHKIKVIRAYKGNN